MHRSFFAFLLLIALPAAAQHDSLPPPTDIETLPSNDGSFTRVEAHPKFPGGEAALMRFMQENLRYPEEMRDAHVQGKVYVGFTIAADGAVTKATVKRGISGGAALEAEALRVVRAMPAWQPATVNGVPVPTEYVLPVAFQLD